MNKDQFHKETEGQISDEQLLQYLNGTLAPARQREIEELLQEDDFLNDAVEGLQQMPDKEQLTYITGQLNRQLHRQLKAKNQVRRQRRKLKEDKNTWLYVLLLLLIAVVSWIFFKAII